MSLNQSLNQGVDLIVTLLRSQTIPSHKHHPPARACSLAVALCHPIANQPVPVPVPPPPKIFPRGPPSPQAARQSMDEMDMRMSCFARSHSNQSAFSAGSSSGSHHGMATSNSMSNNHRGSGLVSLATPDEPTHDPWQAHGGRGRGGAEDQEQMVTPSAGSTLGCGSPPREFVLAQQQRGSFTPRHGAFDTSSGGGSGGGGGGARRRHSYTYAVGSHQHYVTIDDDNADEDGGDGDGIVSGRYSTPKQYHHHHSRWPQQDSRFDGYTADGYAARSGGTAAAAAAAATVSSFSAAHRGPRGPLPYPRPWSRSAAAGGASSATAAAAAANPAGGGAGRDGVTPGGGQQVGHARGLVYAEDHLEEDDQLRAGGAGVGRRGGVHGVDSDEEGVRPGEESDEDDDLADGVFNMELL